MTGAPSNSFSPRHPYAALVATDPPSWNRPPSSQLRDRQHTVVVSAASAREITNQARLSGASTPGRLLSTWTSTLVTMGGSELPITAADAIAGGRSIGCTEIRSTGCRLPNH